MLLPKWLWRLLRSKRFDRFLILIPFSTILGIVIFHWGVNAWGQAKLDATRERMRGLGIPLTEAEREAFLPNEWNDYQGRTAFVGITENETNDRRISKLARGHSIRLTVTIRS